MRGWAGDHPLLSACESSTRHRRHRAWRLDQHGKSSTADDAADATQLMRRSRCDAADAQPTMDASDDATAADHVEGRVWPTLPIRVGVTCMFGLFRVCVSFRCLAPPIVASVPDGHAVGEKCVVVHVVYTCITNKKCRPPPSPAARAGRAPLPTPARAPHAAATRPCRAPDLRYKYL